jgi:hypothetical protein
LWLRSSTTCRRRSPGALRPVDHVVHARRVLRPSFDHADDLPQRVVLERGERSQRFVIAARVVRGMRAATRLAACR